MPHTSPVRTNQISRLIISVLVFMAFFWRIGGLAQESLWRDEIDALYFALGDFERLLAMFIEPGQNGPLYFFVLRAWLKVVGSSEFALRYLSLLFGILTIPMTWQVGRQLLPNFKAKPCGSSSNFSQGWHLFLSAPSVLAATFLAINPHQLWYSQEGKMYTATTLIVLVVIWLFLKGTNRPSSPWIWLCLGIVLIIGFYTHLLLILLLPVLVIWSLFAVQNNKTRAIVFLFILMFGISIFSYRGFWILGFLTTPDSVTGRPFYPLRELVQETFRYQLNGVIPPTQGGIWLIPLIILAMAGLLYGKRLRHEHIYKTSDVSLIRNGNFMIATWLLLPMVSIFFLSLLQPVFAPRYIIWIAPALMMGLALGVQILQPLRTPAQLWLTTLVVIFIIGHGLITGGQQKSSTLKVELRQAVNHLVERREPEELLIFHIPHLELAYLYYSGSQYANPFENSADRPGWSTGGLWTNNHLNEVEAARLVDKEMSSLTNEAREIWVMRSEVEMWDARNLMDQWLQQNGHIQESTNFKGIQVIHYKLDS